MDPRELMCPGEVVLKRKAEYQKPTAYALDSKRQVYISPDSSD